MKWIPLGKKTLIFGKKYLFYSLRQLAFCTGRVHAIIIAAFYDRLEEVVCASRDELEDYIQERRPTELTQIGTEIIFDYDGMFIPTHYCEIIIPEYRRPYKRLRKKKNLEI